MHLKHDGEGGRRRGDVVVFFIVEVGVIEGDVVKAFV